MIQTENCGFINTLKGVLIQSYGLYRAHNLQLKQIHLDHLDGKVMIASIEN